MAIRSPSLLLSVLLLTAAAAAPEDEAALESRRRELAEIDSQMHSLEQDLGERRAARDALLAELAARERDIGDLARADRQLAVMQAEQQGVLADLEQRLAAQRETLTQERAALRGLLRSAYVMGRGERIRLLLDQDDVSRMSRVMAYYGYLNRHQSERIQAVVDAARRTEALASGVAEESRRLAGLAERQAETRQALERARTERGTVLTELERVIAGTEQQVAMLRADAEGMRSLLSQLERQAQVLPEAQIGLQALAARRGTLAWPVDGGRLLAGFGAPKAEGGGRWDGVLIAAPEGMEVRAVHPGRVVFADWLRGFGLLLILEHDDGFMTLYGHNQTLLKERGEWVAEGDAIGLSGASGGRRDAGLYFAIRHRGRPLDPAGWCRPPGRADAAPASEGREHGAHFPIKSAAPWGDWAALAAATPPWNDHPVRYL